MEMQKTLYASRSTKKKKKSYIKLDEPVTIYNYILNLQTSSDLKDNSLCLQIIYISCQISFKLKSYLQVIKNELNMDATQLNSSPPYSTRFNIECNYTDNIKT